MATANIVTKEICVAIKKSYTYNKNTGKIKRVNRKNADGSYDKDGYLIIKFKSKQYKAHRIAWFLHYGVFPSDVIDHINRCKHDNRIENLRDTSSAVNANNVFRVKNKDSGYVGIYVDRSTKGLKAIYTTACNNKTYRFRDLNDAVAFRKMRGMKI